MLTIFLFLGFLISYPSNVGRNDTRILPKPQLKTGACITQLQTLSNQGVTKILDICRSGVTRQECMAGKFSCNSDKIYCTYKYLAKIAVFSANRTCTEAKYMYSCPEDSTLKSRNKSLCPDN